MYPPPFSYVLLNCHVFMLCLDTCRYRILFYPVAHLQVKSVISTSLITFSRTTFGCLLSIPMATAGCLILTGCMRAAHLHVLNDGCPHIHMEGQASCYRSACVGGCAVVWVALCIALHMWKHGKQEEQGGAGGAGSNSSSQSRAEVAASTVEVARAEQKQQ